MLPETCPHLRVANVRRALRAGMTVALMHYAMRLSEIITIYLAVAAPVGVAYFLRHHAGRTRARAMAGAALVGLAWPFTIIDGWLERHRRGREAKRTTGDDDNASGEKHVELCKRASVDALHRVEDILRETSGAHTEQLRRVVSVAHECTERYTGLVLASRDGDAADAGAKPSARETELCRVAGRRGDDLLVAARCIRRRNAARLLAHHERAQTELLHALAEMRETCAALRFVEAGEAAREARRLSEALLEVFGRAVELFSSLDDERAALAVARLLDAECARLRRLENPVCDEARRAVVEGENPCSDRTSPAYRSPLKRLPQPTT